MTEAASERYKSFMRVYEQQIGCPGCGNALMKLGFFEAPASKKFQGAYPGGLFDHSVLVTEHLLYLTEKLNLHWNSPYSPIRIGMLHDLCKADEYILMHDEDGNVYFENNQKTPLKGHGDKSEILASQIMDLTEEEELCIRYHMGAFGDKKEQNLFTDAIHLCPNVLFAHTADMMAAHITKQYQRG